MSNNALQKILENVLGRKMTNTWINLFDAGLALLQTRGGVTINGRSPAELRKLIAEKRPQSTDDTTSQR